MIPLAATLPARAQEELPKQMPAPMHVPPNQLAGGRSGRHRRRAAADRPRTDGHGPLPRPRVGRAAYLSLAIRERARSPPGLLPLVGGGLVAGFGLEDALPLARPTRSAARARA